MTIDAATIHQSRATRFTLGLGLGVSVQSLRGARKLKLFYHRGHRGNREEQLLCTAEDAEHAEDCFFLRPTPPKAFRRVEQTLSSVSSVSSVVKALIAV